MTHRPDKPEHPNEPGRDLVEQGKDELLRFLYDSRSFMSSYHNQKENLGWAGVATYLAAMGAIGLTRSGHHSILENVGVTIAVIGSFILVLAYVRRQFNLREWAARLNFAHNRAILETLIPDLRHPLPDNFVSDFNS